MKKKIKEIKPDTGEHGNPQILGTVTPLVLACGHIVLGNQSTFYKVGFSIDCHECDVPRNAHVAEPFRSILNKFSNAQ